MQTYSVACCDLKTIAVAGNLLVLAAVVWAFPCPDDGRFLFWGDVSSQDMVASRRRSSTRM